MIASEEYRKELHKMIDSINSERLLRQYYTIVGVGYAHELEEAVEDMQNGED